MNDKFEVLKKKAMEKFFSRMNPEQQKAVSLILHPEHSHTP